MSFRYIVAIVRRDTLDDIESRFRQLRVRGMTVSLVKGFGEYVSLGAPDHLTEHAKVEVFVETDRAEAVIETILDAAHSDLPGAGVLAVMPVEEFFHIRTRTAVLPGTR